MPGLRPTSQDLPRNGRERQRAVRPSRRARRSRPTKSRLSYGRGRGVGRALGVGVTLGATVGVAVGVAVGLGVGVGLGATGHHRVSVNVAIVYTGADNDTAVANTVCRRRSIHR